MCVQSMIMDHYHDKWRQYFPPSVPLFPYTIPGIPVQPLVPAITPDEVAEFRRLLERAKEYDKKNNEPDCELKEKRDRVLKLAKELGVSITIED